MVPFGARISRFVAAYTAALREWEAEPTAARDIQHFLSLLDEMSHRQLPSSPSGIQGLGAALPVCSHWRGAIDVARNGPSGTMIAAFDGLRDDLQWVQSEDYLRSPPSVGFAERYGYAVVLGPPTGVPTLVSTDRLAAGVLLIGPRTCYPLHRHPAIELYYVVSGHAKWWRGDGPWQTKAPGSLIHHASEVAHGMWTADEPLLAAYLWKGDLRTDAYFID